jgi:GNAT superfamily N-acetyltransferase
MSQTFQVRLAVSADVPAIAGMIKELARDGECPDVVQATQEDWLRDLFGPHPPFSALIAESSNEVVGTLIYAVERYPGWAYPAIKIHELYVVPQRRRQRIATALFNVLANAARESQIVVMQLNVREANPARNFYERVGFQQVPECLTYVMALPALQTLIETAANLAGDMAGLL